MKRLDYYLVSGILLVVLSGCATTPPLKAGYGSIIVTALAKQDEDVKQEDDFDDGIYESDGTEDKTLYDYQSFNDLVVSVQGQTAQVPNVVTLTLTPKGFTKPFQAAAHKAVIRFVNQTQQAVSFFGYDEQAEKEFNDWPQVAPGQSQDWVVDTDGIVQVFAEEFEESATLLYLSAGEQVAVLPSDKSYAFSDLKPGTYTVTGWHPLLPAERKQVTVKAGERANIQLLFSVDVLNQ
ncbi:hypothetical protein PN36_12650 [Candidatus Thiomargarita nelsonii]|uniref:Lipoprotein n=1 Tax=Candidatus Thiomargarita nelsonii TaxID=1003181 RepID=A0A0A6S8I5_9GAMM|nr:hypothetical protein PN36_12650 [Candidatus Thiomargarita nelsonii]